MENRDYCRQVNAYIGQRIRFRRKQRQLSQGDLGGQVELTFQQIQKYEHGSNRISAALLFTIAHNLDVPITYFFDGIASKLGEAPEDDSVTLLHLLQRIPSHTRAHLCAILHKLADD
jgi:transcriptional regulator with XRE-family HTH domain